MGKGSPSYTLLLVKGNPLLYLCSRDLLFSLASSLAYSPTTVQLSLQRNHSKFQIWSRFSALASRMNDKPYKLAYEVLPPQAHSLLHNLPLPSFHFTFRKYPSASLVAPHQQNTVSNLHSCDQTIPRSWEAFSLPFPLPPKSASNYPLRFSP